MKTFAIRKAPKRDLVPKKRRPPVERPSLVEFLAKRNVLDGWDYCLVGDGSGQGGDRAVGWCCHLVAADSGLVRTLEGCASGAGLGEPELMPYVHGLLAILQISRPERVVIVTDRADLVSIGARRRPPKGHAAGLWSVFYGLTAEVDIKWIWTQSGVIDLNRLADRRAGECRKALLGQMTIEDKLSA
jgi:hypothetical protein